MASPKQKTCPGCQRVFGCGPAPGQEQCWCEHLPHRPLVAGENYDCFCPECLGKAIKSRGQSKRAVVVTGDVKATDLIEGEDYVVEGDTIVFTRSYHLRRGYCCGSGCRHCPYPQ
jgi:hypothetical protein